MASTTANICLDKGRRCVVYEFYECLVYLLIPGMCGIVLDSTAFCSIANLLQSDNMSRAEPAT